MNSLSDTIPDFNGRVIQSPLGRSFNFKETIGQGSWGKVFRVQSTDTPSEEYAVKCINRSILDEKHRRAVEAEVILHDKASRKSSRVLKLIEAFITCTDNISILFLVLEYCPMGDVMSFLNGNKGREYRSRFVSDDEAVRKMFLDMVDAVGECHSNGVYHRDIKPENFLVRNDGTIIISDFGLATIDPLTLDFNIGSLQYMSPELRSVFRSTCIRSPHSDVWALGIVLVNLLFARYPWEQATYDDRDYYTFIHSESTYFTEKFNASMRANFLLMALFARNAKDRLTLEELREEIETIETFYAPSPSMKTEEELKAVEARKDAQARYYQEEPMDEEASQVLNVVALDVFRYESQGTLEQDIPECRPSLDVSLLSSDKDSDGPITPDTIPADLGETNVDTLSEPDELDIAEMGLYTHDSIKPAILKSQFSKVIFSTAKKAGQGMVKGGRMAIRKIATRHVAKVS